MKIIDSFLRSFQKKPKSKKKKTRGLSVTSSSFSSSSSDEFSIVSAAAAGLQTTPRSVLPASSSFLRDFFALFDRDGDGKITRLEIESVLRRLAPAHDPPTAEEVASMVAEVDRDGDGCISLDEFAAVEAALVAGSGAASDEQELMREAFAVFDADGDGKISAEELHGVFDLLFGDRDCTVEECRRMIRGVDTDGDGFVGFDEFATMMMMDGAEAF